MSFEYLRRLRTDDHLVRKSGVHSAERLNVIPGETVQDFVARSTSVTAQRLLALF